MKNEFITWYRDQVQTQLLQGTQIEAVKVDLLLSVVKPLSARWIIKAVECVASNPSEVRSGFKRARILEYPSQTLKIDMFTSHFHHYN